MEKLKITGLFLISLLLVASCTKKEYDITMTMVEDGNLKIQLVDDTGNGIAGVDAEIGYYSSYPAAEGTTDENGWVIFKDVLSGEYFFIAEDVMVNGRSYNVVQVVQVIAGAEKEYVLNASEFSASVTITVLDYIFYEPYPDLNVGIFPSEEYDYAMEFSELLEICIANGVTDEEGKVEFTQLPLDEYGTLLYEDADNYNFDEYSFYLSVKGDESEVTLVFY